MKRGLLLPSIALCVGLLLGLAVIALERYLVRELIEVLQDELSIACSDCRLEYDSLSMSLLRLHASATNMRIVENGHSKLRFAKVEANFSLQSIADRMIVLSELRLKDGFADGVGVKSVTYRFIDQLTAPTPPENITPDRWQVKLIRLIVSSSEFEEPLRSARARGKNVSIILQRNPANDFYLEPRVSELSILFNGLDRPVPLGAVDGLIEIADSQMYLRKIRLTKYQARMEAGGTVQFAPGGPLAGDLHFSLDDESISLSPFLSLALYGAASMSGKLGEPELEGSFSNPTSQPFTVHVNPFEPIEFVKASGNFSLTWSEELPTFTLSHFEAESPSARLTTTTPFVVSTASLDAGLALQVDELILGTTILQQVRADFAVIYPWAQPQFSVTFEAGSLSRGDAALGSAKGNIRSDGSQLNFELTTQPLPDSIPWNLDVRGGLTFGPTPTLLPSQIRITPTSKVAPVSLSLTGQFEGPLTPLGIVGQGDFTVYSGARSIHGSVELKDGLIRGSSTTPEKDLSTTVELALDESNTSTITIEATKLNPLSFLRTFTTEQEQCAAVSGSFRYQFRGTEIFTGNGGLDLPQLLLGCGQYQMQLTSPLNASIEAGTLALSTVAFGSQNSSIVTSGTINARSGYDLKLRGALELPALAPLLGHVDDLQGNVALNAIVRGPLDQPALEGQVSIEHGSMGLEASGISLTDITGAFTIAGRGLDFSDVSGRINEGAFEISGRIEPLAIERSVATMSFKEVFLEPTSETSMTLSGTIGIGPDGEGQSVLSGVINIEGAEFRRTVHWGDVLRMTVQSLFRPKMPIDSLAAANELPELPLDLRISAPRGLIVDTTWGSGELKADLHIQGTLRAPLTQGTIEAIGGWVGLRDRRFEITNGKILFRPPSFDPTLEVLAETTVRSRQGDVVLVLLEVTGPASAPRLTLTSDRGLNEREILTLFTARNDFSSSSRIGGITSGMELDALEALEDRSFLGLGRLVRDLARIDSLSLEPTFSVQRGTVEPSLVARKQIFDHLAVVGETPLGVAETDSRLRLVYDATPALEFSGGIETNTRESRSSLGIDATYTLLGERRRYLDIRMSGNRMFRSLDIQGAIRLNEDSRVAMSALQPICDRIEAFYRSNGFFQTKAFARCEYVGGFVDKNCHQLYIDIEEGVPTYIRQVRLEGDTPPELVKIARLERPIIDAVATEASRKAFEQRVINALRSEGYIASRASSKYEPIAIEPPATGPAVELVLHLTIGDPVTFNFINNTVFTAENFLATIDLFGRRQPFGNNTITILLANIKRLYNEEGYLLASATVERVRDPQNNRLVYNVTIEEGPRLEVAVVQLEGVPPEVESEMKSALYRSDERAAKLIFKPSYAVPEQLEVNASTLQRALAEQGFPDAEVRTSTQIDEELAQITIRYECELGNRRRAMTVDVRGAPTLERPVEIPDPPITIPQLNTLVEDYQQALVSHGYRTPLIVASFENEDRFVLQIDPGPRSYIDEIEIEGYATCSESVIRERLLIKANDPWDEERINASKRRLLRLGLFSRVEMRVDELLLNPLRGKLVVQVHERSLRTLSIGAGVNSELGLHLFGEATDRSLFGDGRSLTARLDTYYDQVAAETSQGVASLSYAVPNLFNRDVGYVSDVRFQKVELDTQEFDLDRVSFSNFIHQSWDSGFSASLGHTILQEDLSNVTPGAVVGEFDTGSVRLGFLSSVLTYDQRDDPLLPTRGYNFGIEAQYAQEVFGSEANYVSLLGRVSYLAPLSFISQRWSLASSTRVGSAWTGPDTDAVPISQRFYLGGRSSVRGFKENSLGPQGSDGAVQGGDLLMIQNLELRYRLWESTQLINFIDVGGLYFHDEPMSIDDLREGAGMGVRYLSPIGPIGFDLGVPLDRRSGESEVRFHFNIGTNY